MRVSPSFCLLMAVMLLLQHPVAALNWQGTGNLNDDNLTVIWSYIHSNFKTRAQAFQFDIFAEDLSITLNAQWDPAWNVVVIWVDSATISYNDAILYGYAFRDHWMWYNGYTDPALVNKQYSFVIWKDYNCQGWRKIGQNGDLSGFSPDQKDKIQSLIGSTASLQLIQSDPWTLAKRLVDAVQADSDFAVGGNHAYSIVLTQDLAKSSFYGRVCMVGRNQYYSYFEITGLNKGLAGEYGRFVMFQTR